jgi:predicted amidohydrolase
VILPLVREQNDASMQRLEKRFVYFSYCLTFILAGKLGLTTCYDLRFPEMYVELARNGGAQILLVPSAFTVPTGNAHWHILLRGAYEMHGIICLNLWWNMYLTLFISFL